MLNLGLIYRHTHAHKSVHTCTHMHANMHKHTHKRIPVDKEELLLLEKALDGSKKPDFV